MGANKHRQSCRPEFKYNVECFAEITYILNRGILVRVLVRIQIMSSDRHAHVLSGGGVLPWYKFYWLN
jgi:hypothetical protein